MSDSSLVEKLLRMASPTSGASEAERVSAALEAAKVFSKGDYVVTDRPPPPRKTRSKRSQPPSRRPPEPPPEPNPIEWFEACPTTPRRCIICGQWIIPGDDAYVSVLGYRHEDIACDQR